MKDKILYIIYDHVTSNERAAQFGGELSDKLVSAQEQIKRDSLPIRLSLRTAINPDTVSPEAKERFFDGVRKAARVDVDFCVDMYPSLSTRKMYGALFDGGAIASGFSAIATGDLDQCTPDTNLDRVMLLYERVKEKGAVLGIGSRNVPVVLAANQENGYLRRIFEGVLNLTAGSAPHPVYNPSIKESPNDPAYEFHGDQMSGIFLFDPYHKTAMHFMKKLVETAQHIGFPGFEEEYLLVLSAPRFGNVVAEYYRTGTNPYDPIDPKEERQKIIERHIKTAMRNLRKTDAGIWLKTAIQGRDVDKLRQFYPDEQIDEVVGYMREALE